MLAGVAVTSDTLNTSYFLFLAGIWILGVNFAGGGWSEQFKRGVIVKGVCVAEGLFRYVHKAV